MVRRTGETIWFALRHFDLLKKRGPAVKPEWEAATRRACDALVKLCNDYGQFGQFIDADTGHMVINGSTGGSVNITALAAASVYFQEPKYLEIAEQAGRFYRDRDLAKGLVCGGPREILQAPDMESSYNLIEGYMLLYETTGKQE